MKKEPKIVWEKNEGVYRVIIPFDYFENYYDDDDEDLSDYYDDEEEEDDFLNDICDRITETLGNKEAEFNDQRICKGCGELRGMCRCIKKKKTLKI